MKSRPTTLHALLVAAAALTVVHCSASSGTSSGANQDDAGIAQENGDAGAGTDARREDASTTPDASGPDPSHKLVFVTSDTFDGNLKARVPGAATGQLAGDALCLAAASRAKLPGTWHAWLSIVSHDAKDRVVGDGPWYSTAGKLVFASKADLVSGAKATIVDESGKSVAGYVWTGTLANGTSVNPTCDEWTNNAGINSVCGRADGGANWSYASGSNIVSCSNAYPIYCFQD